MELKNYFAQDAAGNILQGAVCYLYYKGTQTPVAGLTGSSGAILTNPFSSDVNGLIQFKAPNGEYDLRVVSGVRDYTVRVQCLDVADTITTVAQVVDDAQDQAEAYAVDILAHVTEVNANRILAQQAALDAKSEMDSLRVDLASPTTGAKSIAIFAPSGLPSTVDDELKAIDDEYPQAAWSVAAGMLQTGPLIVKVGRKLKITGDPADSTYNNDAYADMIGGAQNGTEFAHPARGLICLKGGITITAQGISLVGHNSGASYDQCALKFLDATVPAYIVKNSGLRGSNLFLWGAIPGRALNDTQDCFDFDVTLNSGHADARFDNVSTLQFRYGWQANKSKVRNISGVRCVASNNRGLFSLDLVSAAGDDCRVFEWIDCKGHSCGTLGSATDALFYVNPLSQALSLMVDGGHADDTVRVLRGFAGMSEIAGFRSTRARGAYADIDSTGFNQAGYEMFGISDGSLLSIGATSHQFSGIRSQGNAVLDLNGFTMAGAGGHGVELLSDNSTVKGVTVHNASMGLTNTYSGFFIGPAADNTIFAGGNAYRQSRLTSANTTAKYGVENLGNNTSFESRIITDNLAGAKSYYIDPAATSHGPDPVPQSVLPRELWSGSTPPATGAYTLGDIVWNASSSGTIIFWKCVNPNPLTWQAN